VGLGLAAFRGWRSTPNDDIWAKVRPVRPDEGTRLDADLAEASLVGSNRVEDRPAKEPRKIALNDRAIRQRQTNSMAVESFDLSDSYQ
jgi:hypothetical protein